MYVLNFSNHESYIAVRTICLLKNSTPASMGTGSKWQVEASKALEQDKHEKSNKKHSKTEIEKKNPKMFKRTTKPHVDHKPKIGKRIESTKETHHGCVINCFL